MHSGKVLINLHLFLAHSQDALEIVQGLISYALMAEMVLALATCSARQHRSSTNDHLQGPVQGLLAQKGTSPWGSPHEGTGC